MLDIAWSELMLIAVVALVVIGPKDLPKAIYTLGKWVGKARVVAREFQSHIDDMMRETELDELRREALKTRDMNLQKMMEDTVDPKNELRTAFEIPSSGHPGSSPEELAALPAPKDEESGRRDAVEPASPESQPELQLEPRTAAAPVPQPVSTTTDKQA